MIFLYRKFYPDEFFFIFFFRTDEKNMLSDTGKIWYIVISLMVFLCKLCLY